MLSYNLQMPYIRKQVFIDAEVHVFFALQYLACTAGAHRVTGPVKFRAVFSLPLYPQSLGKKAAYLPYKTALAD
jgi:hypothetical protein